MPGLSRPHLSPLLQSAPDKSASRSALFQNRKLKLRKSQGKGRLLEESRSADPVASARSRQRATHTLGLCLQKSPMDRAKPTVLCDLGQVPSLLLSPVSSPSRIRTKPPFRFQIRNPGPLGFSYPHPHPQWWGRCVCRSHAHPGSAPTCPGRGRAQSPAAAAPT